MIRWLIVVVLALLIFGRLTKWLRRFGFGRLPGDFEFRLFRRDWSLPLASTLLLSLLAALIVQLIGAR